MATYIKSVTFDAGAAARAADPAAATTSPSAPPLTASSVAPPTSVVEAAPVPADAPLTVGTVPGTAVTPGTSRP